MAYTPTAPNEHAALALAQANLSKIVAHQAQHGGDLEAAFRAVTGRPWVEGRSLKISNGQPSMTKDRTTASVLGKYVLPAAAIALTGGAAAGVGPLAGVFGGAAGAAGATGAAGAGATAAGTGATVAATGAGGTLLRYGLQYGLPVAGSLIGGRMQANAQSESDRLSNDAYTRALEAEQEERNYRRGVDENDRAYGRAFNEEGRSYGRYSDSYGRASDEENLQYGRANDTYGRASNEERLWYDRSQAIRDKNYGYQQYGNFVETLEPFRSGGAMAASRMSGLMDGPTPQDTGSYLNLAATARNSVQAVPDVPNRPTFDYSGTRPTWDYQGQQQAAGGGQAPQGVPTSTTMPVGGGQPLVRVQAPDGEVRELPAEQAQRAIALGARRV